jgi:uncharacterized protein DUF6220
MITRIFQGLAWLIVGGLAIEFYLAGAALFGATTFQPHRALGVGLAAAIMLLLLVALIARLGRRVVGLAVVLAALAILQVLLPSPRSWLPWISALHALNAVALASVTVNIARALGQPAMASRSRDPLLVTAKSS